MNERKPIPTSFDDMIEESPLEAQLNLIQIRDLIHGQQARVVDVLKEKFPQATPEEIEAMAQDKMLDAIAKTLSQQQPEE